MSGNSASGRPPSIANIVESGARLGAHPFGRRQRLRQQAVVQTATLTQFRVDDEQPAVADRVRAAARHHAAISSSSCSSSCAVAMATGVCARSRPSRRSRAEPAQRLALRGRQIADARPPADRLTAAAARPARRAAVCDSVRLRVRSSAASASTSNADSGDAPSAREEAVMRQSCKRANRVEQCARFGCAARVAAQFAHRRPTPRRRAAIGRADRREPIAPAAAFSANCANVRTRGVFHSVRPASRCAAPQAARIAAWRCGLGTMSVAPASRPSKIGAGKSLAIQ